MRKEKKKMSKSVYQKFLSIFITLTFVLSCGVTKGMAEEAANEDPAQTWFEDAMENRAKGNLYDSMDLFYNILTNQPFLGRARLELAVTFYRLYDYAEAKRQAQIVLDDPDTPSNVRVAVLAFIAQVEKDAEELGAKKHYWKPTFALGWMHDTNVNAGPDGDIIINGRVYQLTPGATSQSDSAVIAIASLSHRYQTGKTVRVGQKNSFFLWQSNISYYHRDYFKEHAFDMGVLSASTGPAFVSVGNWRANLNAQIDYLLLGSDELAFFSSVLPSITKQFRGGAFEITLDGTITDRNYKQDVDEERDSTFYAAQLSMGYTFKRPKLAFQVGGQMYSEDAETAQWSNDGTDIYLGARWEAWTNGVIYARVNEIETDYDGPAAGFLKDREDDETKYTVGVSHTFRNKWLNEWTLNANFVRSEVDSNASTYEYDREQTMVMLSKTF